MVERMTNLVPNIAVAAIGAISGATAALAWRAWPAADLPADQAAPWISATAAVGQAGAAVITVVAVGYIAWVEHRRHSEVRQDQITANAVMLRRTLNDLRVQLHFIAMKARERAIEADAVDSVVAVARTTIASAYEIAVHVPRAAELLQQLELEIYNLEFFADISTDKNDDGARLFSFPEVAEECNNTMLSIFELLNDSIT